VRSDERQTVHSLLPAISLHPKLACLVDGQTIIGQPTGEFVDGQTIGQPTGEFVDGQTIGQPTGEFVDGQTSGQRVHLRLSYQSKSSKGGLPSNHNHNPQAAAAAAEDDWYLLTMR
jgi:hypothetical protein